MAGDVRVEDLIAQSRVAEVRALLEVMKASGVLTLKVGDIELTLAPPAPPALPEDERPRYVSPEEAEEKQKSYRRSMMLASASRIVRRAGE